ncbi:response regulator [bacterium]|nr:response regulator [bacterium]
MRILAADDSFDWLSTHTFILTDIFGKDADIVCANSAFEALNIFKEEYLENPFNLVITDLQMESDFEPLYAGEWLIKEIQALKPNQKILIISSTLNIEQIANSYSVDYFSKRLIVSDISVYENKLSEINIS